MIGKFGIARKTILSLYSAILIICSYNLEFILQNVLYFSESQLTEYLAILSYCKNKTTSEL